MNPADLTITEKRKTLEFCKYVLREYFIQSISDEELEEIYRKLENLK